ncbi:D-alanyl-D-alanine carboxypeptidase family protein [Pseudogracilibacillus sp. SO30301A]|uniref:D-alanyl-D-alanine carboxypeptidase family protein n=1 Tax=Pseudogracilibacillus sp. SO30301A TaxID=3098291 RepID=UPI00300E3B3C
MKRIKLLIILILLTACNSNASEEDKIHSPERVLQLERKNMPQRYVVDPISDLDIQAEAAILINAVTGEVVFEKNSSTSLAVASMSKIMTELLILEAIEEEVLRWEDTTKISDYAYTISNHPGFSSVLLEQDQTYTMEELFHAMAIRSANGATIALAEAMSGSEKEFVALMNERARELGLEDTHFVNSTGLTNDDLQGFHSTGLLDDKNMMSANDLATLTKYIIDRFPDLLEVTKLKEFDFQGETYTNSNWMLTGTEVDFIDVDVTYDGVDGLKTGFTEEAGYGFTGTVQMGDVRVISVIIGTEEIEDRFLETIMLYEAVEEQM